MLDLTEILESLDLGKISVSKAKKLLSLYSVEKIEDFAKIDVSRKLRRGIPEVVFAEKKELSDLKKIIITLTSKADSVILSRINKDHYKKILVFSKKNKLKIYTGKNTTTILYSKKLGSTGGKVGILTAGTSDIGVAEEARLVCESMGCKCICSYDIGIAGIHRLFPVIKKVIREEVDVIIFV